MSPALCPICRQELSSALCSRCGYDESRQYERFPTLVCLPDEQKRTLSSLRAAWLARSAPEVQDPAVLFQRALQSGGGSEQLELLSRASYLGYPPAQACLGEQYLQQGKADLAFSLFQASAQQGNSSACYHLSHCYRDGVGVKRSPQLALSWLSQASARGHIKAGTELADKLLAGQELPRDLAKAEELYRWAALAGLPDGLVHLAKCFRDGSFAPRSPGKAAELLKEAGKHGSREAALLLDDLSARTAPPPPSKPAGTKPSPAPSPAGTRTGAASGGQTKGAAAQPRAAAGTRAQAAGSGPRPYSQGRAYERDRFVNPGAASRPSPAARSVTGVKTPFGAAAVQTPPPASSPAPAPSGVRSQPAAGSPAPAPAPTSDLEKKSLGSLRVRRGLDIFLVVYLISLSLCALGDAFGTEASIPAAIVFAVLAWPLIRRCKSLTRAIRAKKARSAPPTP